MRKIEANESRADYLAREALDAQLKLLHGVLPMTSWVIAQHEGQDWQVMAISGDIAPDAADHLIRMLSDSLPPDASPASFEYRPCRDTELTSPLFRAASPNQRPAHVFQASLALPGGQTRGLVLGLQQQATAYPLTADAIHPCLNAMLCVLNLHAELVATERLVLKTRQEALLDPLTHTLNRAGWDQYVQQIDTSLKSTDVDAVIGVVDLDFLKSVNDSKGHAAGDDMLKLTAQAIHAVLRRRDCVARLGGDEFAILLQDITPADAGTLRERLIAALQAVGVSVSFGLALKSEAGSLKKALALADTRMYAEKRKKPMPNNLQRAAEDAEQS